MKKIYFIPIFFFFLAIPGYSQNPIDSDSTLKDYLSTLATVEFGFDSPGDDFEKLADGSGFTCLSKKATIKYIVVPGSYESAISEIAEKKGFGIGTGINVIDTFSAFKGDRHLLFLLSENVAPPGVKEENMYIVTTFMRYSANVTLGIIAAYPKSRDAAIRKKLVDAAFSLHKL